MLLGKKISPCFSKETGQPVLKVLRITVSSFPQIISKLGYLACACWPVDKVAFLSPSKYLVITLLEKLIRFSKRKCILAFQPFLRGKGLESTVGKVEDSLDKLPANHTNLPKKKAKAKTILPDIWVYNCQISRSSKISGFHQFAKTHHSHCHLYDQDFNINLDTNINLDYHK